MERPTCSGCRKSFPNVEALSKHERKAMHDPHDPRCMACGRLFRTMASLREHLQGKLSKSICREKFEGRGCSYCLRMLKSTENVADHVCWKQYPCSSGQLDTHYRSGVKDPRVIALDCEMVAVEGNQELSACARVCLVDEEGTVILHTFVRPEAKVLDYREEITAIKPKDLETAPPLRFVARLVQGVLDGAEIRYHGTGALDVDFDSLQSRQCRPRLLVGHDLRHDLSCLGISHPLSKQRDTATYSPFLRANGHRPKLRELCSLHLGLQIQDGGVPHCPMEDARATMKLYWFAISFSDEHRLAVTEFAYPAELRPQKPSHCWCMDFAC